jgi:hypothetical protein
MRRYLIRRLLQGIPVLFVSLRRCVVLRLGEGPVADSSDQHPGWRQFDDEDLPPTCARVSVQAHAQHGGGHGSHVILRAGRG